MAEEMKTEKKGRKRDRANSIGDALLPHANIGRVMRRSLRPKTMLSNQAVLAAQVFFASINSSSTSMYQILVFECSLQKLHSDLEIAH